MYCSFVDSLKKNRFYFHIIYRIAVAILFILLFNSCKKNTIVSAVETSTLFTLEHGSFEDELNVFDLASVGDINTSLCMTDGFVYIANGESKKIMEMNSYGELLALYYNEGTNPKPSFASESKSAVSTRRSISYPFNKISSIAVDSNKALYVVDKLPLERQETNDEYGNVLLTQIVLRFDSDGNYIDYLGQEGRGGTPFPYVNDIYITDDNNLIVLSTISTGKVIYWFSEEGKPLFRINFENDVIPNPYSVEDKDAICSVENIIPDLNRKILYVKADYYSSFIDDAIRVQAGMDYRATLVYPFNLETGEFEQPLEIPPYSEEVLEGLFSESFSIPYDFIGTTSNGWLFFAVSTAEGLNVQMVQSDGQKILKRNLNINRQDCLFYDISLSNTGKISALIVQQEKTLINQWRTDSLIQAVISN